ncbi:HAD family hydrolase [Aestuariispira ectoiniformans]|uniref:HAD family hydrolase n=1 Tax=Aestuariispira ectoiniformans TaxID=2775080 RepID=UPI00223ACC4D|nr:HAD family hydrolase [Aestuariispira ectoiniformans]
MSKFDLVIFDCDGVLVDSEALSTKVWVQFLADHGLPYGTEDIAAHAGLTDRALRNLISEETGYELPDDTPQQIEERATSLFDNELNALPGVLDAVSRLTLPKCVCSNSGMARLHRSLRTVGLFDHFGPDRIYHASLVGKPKPAPDLHLHALERMGATAEHAVVIEDSVTGVTAARAAGITVFGYTAASHLGEDQADKLRAAGASLVFNDMNELDRLLNVA